MYSEALGKGAVSLYEGGLDEDRLFPGQDISTYFSPAALLGVARSCALYYKEPFGPLDSVAVVDTTEV